MGFVLSEEFFYLCMCVCARACGAVWGCTHSCACVPVKARVGIGSRGDKMAGGSELPQVGAGNQTLVLWKDSKALSC